jgi:hypothetical protein
MDIPTLMIAPEPVPWYKSEGYGRAIAIAQAATLAWVGGAVFEIAIATAIKEFGLMPHGTPKTPLGQIMGGFVVLAVTLGSLFVGTRLAEAIPPINGVSIGAFDMETLGISAALAAQQHFNLSEFVVGITPSSAVKGKRLRKRLAHRAHPAPPPVPPLGGSGGMAPPGGNQGPPPPMQTNPNAMKPEPQLASPGQTPLSNLPVQGSAPQHQVSQQFVSPEATASSSFGVSINDAYAPLA